MTPETETSIREFIASAEGWTTIEKALEMAELVIETKPASVVEIGSFAGRMTVTIALALKEIGRGKLFAIDPWKQADALEGENEANQNWWSNNVDLHQMHRLTMEGIWKYNLDEHCVVIRAASQNCHELFRAIDCLLIDGNHSEIASCRDVELFLPRVRAGGFVWFDDVEWSSTRKAVGLIEDQCNLMTDGGNYRLYYKR